MAFSAVYPAIWAFWGIAKFGWSPFMVGASLAAFGLVTALFQGFLAGPAVARFGERRTALIGLACGALVAAGYGLAPGLAVVLVLLVVHGPEGFVHPMLTAMMSQQVPEDAQGELQGGISAIMNVAMLAGTLFFGQVFGVFMADGRAWQSPDVGFFIAAAGLAGVTALFMRAGKTG
jgi:DHA1 family tetracycline resistance protein-like MFS transporter